MKRAHVLTYLHGRIIMVLFERCFHEVSLWRGQRSVIYFILTKQVFMHFIHHWDRFYYTYINSTIRNKYFEDNGTGLKPKHFYQNH